MAEREILQARARALATRMESRIEGEQRSALVVAIATQRYAFPFEQVRRVVMVDAITPLPHVPPLVLGLGSCDGELLVIFDARRWCDFPPAEHAERAAVVVLGLGSAPMSAPLALAVDALEGTAELGALEPLPAAVRRPWLTGVTREGVLVVEVAALLNDPAFSIGHDPIAGAAE